MINKKTKVAEKVLAVIIVLTLLFAANCTVLSVSADTLGTTIYLKTTKTTTPYLHYWNNAKKIGSNWPGVAMTAEGGDVYSYELPCDVGDLEGVIFKKDGGNGDDSKLTQDVTNISGNLYDLDAGKWEMYDTSGIKIKSAGADLESPQYVGSKVTLSMDAEGGDGNLQYKISVNDTVLSDYSSKKSVLWTPEKAGDYTVTFEVKDGSGETNLRQIVYKIQSTDDAEDPIFLSASPANGSKIKKGSDVTVDVQGAGGHVNNNILFYKTEIKDPNGNVVNTAYYQTGNKVTFTPSELGEYTVVMYIQNNTIKNTTTTATYTYVSSNEVDVESDTDSVIDTGTDTTTDITTDTTTDTSTDESTDTTTDTSTDENTDTDTEDSTVGDLNGNGKVELKDAYTIQARVLAKMTFSAEEVSRADVNHDGLINLKDASLIQQFKAGLITLD